MTSQSTLAISGTWTSLLLLLLAVLRITLTLQNLIPLDQKIIVGKLRPMVYQLKTEKTLHTVVVQTHTRSMNGTKQEFLKDSTGIVLM